MATALITFLICLTASLATAQDQPAVHQHPDTSAAGSAWTWTTDASVFAGFNYQSRRFADFAAWESQNWLMATAERRVGAGRLRVRSMLSLEPLTVGRYVYVVNGSRFRAGGSPQLFQTGESFDRLPLVDYQHPHDLVAGLGATLRLPRGGITYVIGADLVGSPTLGPTPFMHRESGRNNPQAPLAHHQLDATHSTPGVIRGGIDVTDWTLEASVFRGEEPDEQRFDIDPPRLDSWAGRVAWRRGPWQAQVSGGLLHEPEWFEPYDQTRLTASIAFNGSLVSRPVAATAAWGQTREHTPFGGGVANMFLAEWDLRATESLATFGRAEVGRKEVLGLAVHPKGFGHPHFFSDIAAVTLGAVHDLSLLGLHRLGRFGIGADITVYRMSADLRPLFGGSRSFHTFLRWRPRGASEHVH